jgi:hypothetical protein
MGTKDYEQTQYDHPDINIIQVWAKKFSDQIKPVGKKQVQN